MEFGIKNVLCYYHLWKERKEKQRKEQNYQFSKSFLNVWRERKLQAFGNTGSRPLQTSRDKGEKKLEKVISKERESFSKLSSAVEISLKG